MARKARAPKRLRIGELEVSAPAELALSLAAMRDVLPTEGLGFHSEAVSREELRCFLSGSNLVFATADRQYRVLPFLTTAYHRFWIGMELKFLLARGEAQFSSASLIVFRSPLASEIRQPLLRAEWEKARDGKPGRHAQPHWHIYEAAAEATGEGRHVLPGDGEERRVSLAENAEAPDEVSRPAAVRRFHLAMAARWHLDEPEPHYQPPDGQGVGRWIRSCALYTREQLSYIAGSNRPLEGR